MPSQESVILRIHGDTGIRIDELQALLGAIDNAYNSIWVLDDSLSGVRHYRNHELWWFDGPGIRWSRKLAGSAWPPSPEAISTLVPSRHRLLLRGATFNSPGAWDFIGKMNPLEVLRQYLSDRHERRKDREYRENAEKRKLELESERLELENQLLAGQVLAQRIEVAKSLGLRDEDIAPQLNVFLSRPLRQLERYQDQGLITTAEIVQKVPIE
jgi:hypothetical protein